MFTPKWKKEALHLAKGGRKFIDYKRDLLTPDRVAEIESRRVDLLNAVKAKDTAKVREASKQLQNVCEKALPYQKPLGWLEENVEVMFVAIVIALGLRAYYLQPFRIPTGSMQPTLNGIIGTSLKESEWPSLPQRLAEKALRGRTYVKVVNDQERQIVLHRLPQGGEIYYGEYVKDAQFLHFFSRSTLFSANGAPPLMLPSSTSAVLDAGLRDVMIQAQANNGVIPAGAVLCEGYVDTGDLVLVDKFSYHFRNPKRGEVFVFDTTGNKGIQANSAPGAGTTHYIKRLCGLPGDSISVSPPHLLVNGHEATEAGIVHVSQTAKDDQGNIRGYVFANAHKYVGRAALSRPEATLHLAKDAPDGLREYAAFGDNSSNSLDSRYWGSVKEYNLVGPALFSLWPITTGHWGFIR